jgi:hypothetical protein
MVPNVTIMAHYPQALHVRFEVDADVGVNPEELVSTAALIFFESMDADLGVDGVGSGGSRGGHGVGEDNHEAKDGESEDVGEPRVFCGIVVGSSGGDSGSEWMSLVFVHFTRLGKRSERLSGKREEERLLAVVQGKLLIYPRDCRWMSKL